MGKTLEILKISEARKERPAAPPTEPPAALPCDQRYEDTMASLANPRAEPSRSDRSSTERRLASGVALIAVASIVVGAFVPSVLRGCRRNADCAASSPPPKKSKRFAKRADRRW